MKKYFDILKECQLFEGLGEDELLSMLSCFGARKERYEKKSMVISEGDVATHIGVVLSGSVQITQTDWFGNRSIVGRAVSGDIFGESFACAGVQAMPVSVVAEEKSDIMLIDSARILNPCENACSFHRSIIYNLMRIMAMKNLVFHQKIEVTSKRTTREKLMAFLMLEAKRAGSKSFKIPFDRQELADYLGVDRSGLSAEIGKLRREGIIESEKNRFKLL